MSPETKYKIQVRNMAWKKYAAYRDYKNIRNKVNKMVKRDHWSYKKKLIKSFKETPKRFYGYMRRSQKVKPQVSHHKKKMGV